MSNPTINLLFLAATWLAVTLILACLHRRGRLKTDLHLDLAALGLLALATAGFFWRVLTSERVYTPGGGGDLAAFLYPLYSFIADSLRQGVFPLWNPYLYGGAPFAADIQTGLFYPLHWPVLLLDSPLSYRALEMLAIFHVWLAGATMYVCLLSLSPHLPGPSAPRLLRPSALAGALAFMFSDLFIIHLGNLNLIEVAAWLPLIFLLFHRALLTGRLRLAVGAGVVLAIAFFAGHIQPFLYILVALTLYLGFRILRVRSGQVSDPSRSLGTSFGFQAAPPFRHSHFAIRNSLLAYAVMLVVGLGLAAPLFLPSLEMAGLTVRADTPYQTAMQYSLAPAQLIGLLIPNFFGRDPAQFWGPWDRVEVGYLGIFPLILAALALILRQESLRWFFGGLAILSLFLAFGGYSALQGWVHAFVPGFDKLRAPARFIYLLDFALAALAALGLDALLRPLDLRQRLALRGVIRFLVWGLVIVAAVGSPLLYQTLLLGQDKDPGIFARMGRATNGWVIFLVLAGLSVAWLLARRYRLGRTQVLAWLAVGLIALDLITLGSNVDVGENDPTRNFQHPAAVSFLRQDQSLYRIDTRTEVWDVWQPDLSLLYGIQDVSGIWNPLALADYDAYWENMGSRSSPLYDFLNAGYIIGHKDVKLDMSKFTLAFDGDPQVNIYRNKKVLPRAQVIYQAQVLPHDQVLAALRAPGFDPAQTVILERRGDPVWSPLPEVPNLREGSGAEIIAYDANAMQVQVTATAPGYLVLSEVYYPGWRAWVDGQEAEVLRANSAFRAVAVPAGSHHLRMVFEPDSWRRGVIIAGSTLLGLIAAGVVNRRRRA